MRVAPLYFLLQVVGVAQLVELRLVMPAVVGSSPIVHPILITDFINIFFEISRVDIPWTLSLNRGPDDGLFCVSPLARIF